MARVLIEEPSRFQIGLYGVDWPRFIKSNTGLRKTSRLSIITAELNASDSQTTSTESPVQRIMLEKDLEKKCELVMEYISLLMREWTKISSISETDLNKSLYSYGIDSTAALTLKMQFEANLQVSFEVGSLITSTHGWSLPIFLLQYQQCQNKCRELQNASTKDIVLMFEQNHRTLKELIF